ncbi:MAG: sigma factor [Roseiarcus sp.]
MAAAAPLDELAAHRTAVRGLLLRLTRDPVLADDLAQEALLRAVRAFPRLRGEASPGTWITAIALNLVFCL